MKTLITLAAIAATLTTMTVPAMASAQPLKPVAVAFHSDSRVSAALDNRIDQLKGRIAMGKRTHKLTSREALNLTVKLNNIAAAKHADERSGRGIDGREAASLNSRLDSLSRQIRFS